MEASQRGRQEPALIRVLVGEDEEPLVMCSDILPTGYECGVLNGKIAPGGTVAIWWKGMMRGDATRLTREAVARELGLSSPPDLLTAEFNAFDASGLEDRRLRVVPWIVHMSAERYFGYELSRARARAWSV